VKINQEVLEMVKPVGMDKGQDTGLTEETKFRTIDVQDWLADPERYLHEIQQAEVLLERLLKERESLLRYIKALRSWAREIVGGTYEPDDQPSDMVLLEATLNLPGYLRKEIQNDEQCWKDN
jgi:hypothetical protein